MYRLSTPRQLSFEHFYLPFRGKLLEDNRWVKLAELIPWETFEEQYIEQLSEERVPLQNLFRWHWGH